MIAYIKLVYHISYVCFDSFAQTSEFEVDDLEIELRSLSDSNGNPIRRLYANKGL